LQVWSYANGYSSMGHWYLLRSMYEKVVKETSRVGNHPDRELSSGAVRAAARVERKRERKERKRWRVERGIQ